MHIKPIAIITGSAHRLGREFALFLAQRGFSILLHYNSASEDARKTSKMVEACGVPVLMVQSDLTNEAGIIKLFKAVDAFSDKIHTHISVLINSAAIFPKMDIKSITIKDWDNIFAINLRAPFLITQLAARRMTEGGIVINISDIAARKLWTQYSAYVISKSALETLTRLQAKAYAPRIRVNAIAPGLIFPSEEINSEEWEKLIERMPTQKPVSPDEIVRALDFLLQNESITGQILTIDGGYSLV